MSMYNILKYLQQFGEEKIYLYRNREKCKKK